MFVKASSQDPSFLSQYPQPLAPNYHGHPFLAVNFYKMIGLLVLSKYRNEKHIYIFSLLLLSQFTASIKYFPLSKYSSLVQEWFSHYKF